MESQALSVNLDSRPRKRGQWRLRVLLAFGLLVLILHIISRLEPEQARSYGSLITTVYQVFNPPIDVELSESGKQFIADVHAMGGNATQIGPERKFFGLLPADEMFVVGFSGEKFDDMVLASFASNHPDRITALHLVNTNVTDAGLKYLKQFPNMSSLSLVSPSPIWVAGKRVIPITDAGMAQLELKNVVNLSLLGLPITDAGLKSLPELASLRSLQLTGTKIEGPGLSRITDLRNLEQLDLNSSAVTDDGLRQLATAKSLVRLLLDGTPISAAGLKAVAVLPRLQYLSIRSCQVSYEDVEQIRANAPTLKIDR